MTLLYCNAFDPAGSDVFRQQADLMMRTALLFGVDRCVVFTIDDGRPRFPWHDERIHEAQVIDSDAAFDHAGPVKFRMRAPRLLADMGLLDGAERIIFNDTDSVILRSLRPTLDATREFDLVHAVEPKRTIAQSRQHRTALPPEHTRRFSRSYPVANGGTLFFRAATFLEFGDMWERCEIGLQTGVRHDQTALVRAIWLCWAGQVPEFRVKALPPEYVQRPKHIPPATAATIFHWYGGKCQWKRLRLMQSAYTQLIQPKQP